MFDKILVAVDGSVRAYKALEIAVGLQKENSASELYILSVYREDKSWDASVSFVAVEQTQSTAKVLEENAKLVAEKSKKYAKEQGVTRLRSFYISGSRSGSILSFSREHNIDLIVMGRKGFSNASNLLLGSVTNKVSTLATCPVLIV